MKFSFGNNNVIDSLLFVALVAHSVVARPFTGQRHSFFSLFFHLQVFDCFEYAWKRYQVLRKVTNPQRKEERKKYCRSYDFCCCPSCVPRRAHNFSFFCYEIIRNEIGSHRFLTQFYRLYRLLELLEQAKHLIPFKKWSFDATHKRRKFAPCTPPIYFRFHCAPTCENHEKSTFAFILVPCGIEMVS